MNSKEQERLLKEIKSLIELYNKYTDNKLELQQQYNDVSNIYIGVYDYTNIGLFKAIEWGSPIYKRTPYSKPQYDSGIIYKGINSDKVSIKDTHKNNIDFVCFRPIGESIIVNGDRYYCNCKMNKIISFDELRLILYNNNQIPKYTIGRATDEELTEILNLAYNYFDIPNHPAIRTKNINKQ